MILSASEMRLRPGQHSALPRRSDQRIRHRISAWRFPFGGPSKDEQRTQLKEEVNYKLVLG